VRAFVYADTAQLARDVAGLDTARVAPRGGDFRWPVPPTFVRSANLIAVVLVANERQLERVQLAFERAPQRNPDGRSALYRRSANAAGRAHAPSHARARVQLRFDVYERSGTEARLVRASPARRLGVRCHFPLRPMSLDPSQRAQAALREMTSARPAVRAAMNGANGNGHAAPQPTSAYFGTNTFGATQIRARLPKKVGQKLHAPSASARSSTPRSRRPSPRRSRGGRSRRASRTSRTGSSRRPGSRPRSTTPS
jgi:hypothetical protein